MRLNRSTAASAAVVGLLLASGADAHVFGEHAGGFAAGAAHPFTGLDHLLAMIAIGMWSAQGDARSAWAVAVSFVAAMAAGSALALGGFALPHVEAGIAASVLVLGLIVALAVRLPLLAGVALSGAFALFHGYAHGAELPAMGSPFAYAVGFLLATAALIATGYAVGRTLNARLLRLAGLCVAAAGAAFLATA
jgi:urease accessory protein